MDKGRYGRQDRLIKEKRNDPYRERGKYRDSTICCECGALFVNGRWSWKKREGRCFETTCPACLRIADKYPAGYVMIRGPFFRDRQEEILNLLKNIEKLEKGEHPLERIMSIKKEKDHTAVSTTGVHIARRIGDALCSSYQGDLTLNYEDGEKRIRVQWER
jgi:NMD protein affecting ribosome stability and mRNA decay